MQIWDQCDVDQRNIVMSHIMLELADRFQERLAFDVTNSSTDFNNGNFRILSSRVAVEAGFDLVCNMWDNLNRSSAEISVTFLL